MRHHGAENATFRGDEPTWANACVGENGNPQIYEYATGFASAANVLLDEVIKGKGSKYVDAFIYPICFNMRHAAELFLKSAAQDLMRLAAIRSEKIPEFDTAGSHDLGKIWNYVEANALAIDDRYDHLIGSLKQYIADIAEIDATGQVFRYPFDVENQKHLTELAIINVIVLKDRFNTLEELLNNLHRLNEDLIGEYGWGSFTRNLSRAKLIKLATELPLRAQWQESTFPAVKSYLQGEYKLSSNEFSKALKIIQTRHEIAALIGISVDIPGLDLNTLTVFIDLWSKIHDLGKFRNPPPPEVIGFEADGFEFDGMKKWHSNRVKCRDALTATLTPQSFAVLRALFYFQREDSYSEVFDLILKNYQEESAAYLLHPKTFSNDALHLLDKTNAVADILNSLNFLGQNELLEAVIDHYDFGLCRKRILEVSDTRKKRLKSIALS